MERPRRRVCGYKSIGCSIMNNVRWNKFRFETISLKDLEWRSNTRARQFGLDMHPFFFAASGWGNISLAIY